MLSNGIKGEKKSSETMRCNSPHSFFTNVSQQIPQKEIDVCAQLALKSKIIILLIMLGSIKSRMHALFKEKIQQQKVKRHPLHT